MKTILHVIDSVEPGGAETVFAQLADGVRSFGYRSIVVVSGYGWLTEELLRRGLIPIVINAKGTFNLTLLRALIVIIKDERVDVIQSHLLGSNVYCALAGMLTKTPVIATFHGMIDVDDDERLIWLKRWIMNCGVKRFVAVSERLRDAVFNKGLLSRKKTTVIYNGIDPSRYGKSNEGALRQVLGLTEDIVLIGCLGNLHPAKGYEFLVEAVGEVVATNPLVHFVVAGETKPHLIEALRAQVEATRVSGYVSFIGFVTNSAEFLSQLDLFVLPSLSEGFSIATVEAMASGLPIVVTRCGGPEEIVTHRRNALVIEPRSHTEIARAVLELLASPQLANSLSFQARQFASDHFSLHSMLSRYAKLYDLG